MNLIYVMNSNVFVGNILWTIFLLSTSCESGTMNISEETTTAILIPTSTTSTSPTTTVLVRTRPKPSHETLVLCQCGSGEVMNSTGQCQPLVGGTTVPLGSKDQRRARSESNTYSLESTTDFKVVINEPVCQYHKVDLQYGQFLLRRRGDLLVFKGDRRGFRVAEYCIHHKLVEGRVEVTARGCVPQPVIPRCCAQGEHMNNGECVTNPKIAKPFNPYLTTASSDHTLMAGVTFPWDDHQERLKKPTCAPGYSIKKIVSNILIPKISDNGWRTFLKLHQYCVDVQDNNDKYHAYYCEWNPEAYCKDKLCTIKCCPEGHALSLQTRNCLPNNTTFNSPFLNTSSHLETRSTLYGGGKCYNWKYILEGNFTLIHDGRLLHRDNTYPLSKFCTDNLIMGDSVETGAIACIPYRSIQATTLHLVRKKVFPVCIALSCVSLVLLILLHAWIPKLREMGGIYQLFHAASLFLAYSATMAVQILVPMGYIKGESCVALAFVMQFAFLSAFFWLNTMCFDVWRLFRNLVRSMYSAHSTVATWKYLLYALGGPLTITVITIIVQYVAPKDGSVPGLVHPHIGEGRCWFRSDKELLVYFYGPIGVLFLLNFIFIGTTYYYFTVIRGDCKSKNDPSGYTINSGETKRKYEFFAGFWQHFYLLVVVAFCWLTEILSWLISPKELWAPTDILSNLQGVFVFFVFLAHHNNRALLKEKLPKLFKFSDICINHARTAQTYVSNSTKKLSKKISSSTIL